MRTRPNETLKALRKIIGRTQTEFAAMIGASKDTVVSWECGRNKLSLQFAQRIRSATGANGPTLCEGKRAPLNLRGLPYTADDFVHWTQGGVGQSNQATADLYFDLGSDALRVMLSAAATPGRGKLKNRLPAVWWSFVEWLERARQDFQLAKEIDALLAKRTATDALTASYGFWRSNPLYAEYYGFKDDKRKAGSEMLRLAALSHPQWLPGGDMRQGADRNVVMA